MHTARFAISSLAMAALLLAVSLAFFGSARAQGQVGANAAADIEIGAGVDASVGADARAQAGANADGTVSAEEEEEGDAAANGAARADGRADAGIEASVSAGNSVSISAREIRGMTDVQKAEFLTTVKTHAQVQSQQDLENFAKGVFAADANVEAVEASEEEVQVRYRVPARFLGIFEASLPATVVVRSSAAADAAGTVQARLPWYSFLFGVSESFSGAALASEVSSHADVSSSVSNETSFSAQTQARLVNAISTLLKARASAAADVSADASVQ